jgi:hypothetical protein
MARDSSASAASAGSTPAKVKKPRWYTQIWQAYQMTRKNDPAVTWIVLGTFVGIIALGVLIGLLIGHTIYMTLLSIPFAVLGAMFLLARRAESSAYANIEGQPGASRAALGTIRRGWTFAEEPVAVDPRTQDMVFRGLGRAGVVLVSEGPAGRVNRLLEAERKRTARVISGAPITIIQSGNEDGQVALRSLPRAVQRLKPKLTKQEVAEVSKRLTALGGVRMPVPKGVDPLRARPDRKGMRGR